jgi:anaerobic magnesium-protoporphyrin IX monomethyl ester cyclase
MKTLLLSIGPYNAQGLDTWHDHGAGMTYAAAKKEGCDISFFDMRRLKDDNDLVNVISSQDQADGKGFELIAFGMKSSYYPIGLNVIDLAKGLGKKVIVGGYHVTAAAEQLQENPDVDWIFHGESEITFPIFLQHPEKFGRDIYGAKPQDLDALPWFDRSIYNPPTENVLGWWYGRRHTKMSSVVSARGCPYKCTFCQPIEDNHFGKKLRRRSVDNLINEMLWLRDRYNPDCIMIHDDTFMIQNSWLEEFIEKYPQVGLQFWASARADNVCDNPDLVQRLVKVGWNLVSIGFESGSQRILDKIKKGTTVEQNYEAAKIVKKAGAMIYANYIVGFPNETMEETQSTARMIDEINAEMSCWAYFTPYPGCELGDECEKDGTSLLDRNNYNRMPEGKKITGIDYGYLDAVTAGLRWKGDSELYDIIIPTYEKEEYTVDCLNSIKEFTHDYRIIWIDNGSKETSKIEAILETIPHLSYKFPTNQGFVNAINKGLSMSNAPHVVFLNNDTKVTKGWLDKLTHALYSDPKNGIIGPLTGFGKLGPDSQHSLQFFPRLLTTKARFWEVEQINEELEKQYLGQTAPIDFVAFMCALLKREVINKVGLLDTNFDLGMWDDVDYGLRAKDLGYKTVIALDTCIYHRGRTTFQLLAEKENLDIQALIKINRKKLDAKRAIPPVLKGYQKKNSMRMV